MGRAAQGRPTEILPDRLDNLPTVLKIMLPQTAATHKNIRVMTWDEFFTKFDLLGLAFVYDNDSSGYNELLQIEAKDPAYSNYSRAVSPNN